MCITATSAESQPSAWAVGSSGEDELAAEESIGRRGPLAFSVSVHHPM